MCIHGIIKNRFSVSKFFLSVIIFSSVFLSGCMGETPSHTVTSKPEDISITEEEPTQTASPSPIPTASTTPTHEPLGELTFDRNVNVRSGPGMSFQVTNVVKNGDTLPIYGRSEDSQWVWVDPIEPFWVSITVATANIEITTLPLGPTVAPTATKTMVPSLTPRPSPTLIPAISLNTIYSNFETMTALQFKEYKTKIVGKPVREMVTVGNVSERGVVSLHGDWSPYIINWSDFCVVLTGMPKDELLKIDGGDDIYIEAIINGIVGNNNYYINCENTLVLNYKGN
jgi:hypothetical protein